MTASVPVIRRASLIPRHIAALCQLAEHTGLSVGPINIEPLEGDDEESEGHIVTSWSGPGQLFHKLGIFSPGQRRILESPIEVDTYLSVPGDNRSTAGWRWCPLVLGTAQGSIECMNWKLYLGEAPMKIEERDGVEISQAREFITHHGTVDALRQFGVPLKRLPLGTRPRKRGKGDDIERGRGWYAMRWWGSCRQPDGTIVYREETDRFFAAREKEILARNEWYRQESPLMFEAPPRTPPSARAPYLRLVVDNSNRVQ